MAGLELLLEFRDDFADFVGDTAEIAALNASINVVYRLNVCLVQIGRYAVAMKCGYVAYEPRDWRTDVPHRTGGCDRGRHRSVAQLVKRAHEVLRRLHRKVVG